MTRPVQQTSRSTRRPPPVLRAEVEEATRQERRRAFRALLMRPLLTADGPLAADFVLVRRHASWLREWFAHHANWSLLVTPEVARLRKIPARTDDGTRPAVDATSGQPFTRRRYILWCLALAVLERADRQTTLGSIATQTTAHVQGEPVFAQHGIEFSLGTLDERRDLVHVLRLLLRIGVLRRVQGEEERFIRDHTGDALYNVIRPALASLIAARRSPSLVSEQGFDARLEAITEEPLPDTPDGRNRQIRISLVRRFLDDPVVYYHTLNEEERAYLDRQRPFLLREIEEATGLVPEVRAEGIALVDLAGDVSDLGLPEEGTEGHLTLLLATYLAERRRRQPDAGISREALVAHTAKLIREHKTHWRKEATLPGAEKRLTALVIDKLAGLGLLRQTDQSIVPLPAIGRYGLRNHT